MTPSLKKLWSMRPKMRTRREMLVTNLTNHQTRTRSTKSQPFLDAQYEQKKPNYITPQTSSSSTAFLSPTENKFSQIQVHPSIGNSTLDSHQFDDRKTAQKERSFLSSLDSEYQNQTLHHNYPPLTQQVLCQQRQDAPQQAKCQKW